MKTSKTKTVTFWIMALAVVLALTASPALAADKPNILFIRGDDIGLMQPQVYHRGWMVGETPNVDRIAQEGGIFMDYSAQPCRAAGQLRHGQTGAHRVHAGVERCPAGGTALHRRIVHEDAALLGDTVDVRRFADHPAAVIDLRLHQADVVAHDEQDVGFVGGECRHGRQGQCHSKRHNP